MSQEEFSTLSFAAKMAVIYERVDNLKNDFDNYKRNMKTLAFLVTGQLLATIGTIIVLGVTK